MIKLLKEYLKPYRFELTMVVILQIITAAASLSLPTINAHIIDEGVAKNDIDKIWYYGFFMLGGAFIQATAQISAVYFGARAAIGLGHDLMDAVYRKLMTFSAPELNKFSAGSLVTRNTNDVRQVMMIIFMTCVMIIRAPITMAGGVIMSLREDFGLSWLILVAVAALAIMIGAIVVQLMPLFDVQQKRVDTINRVMREQIGGRKVIRAFTREPYESKRFQVANEELTSVAMKIGIRLLTLFPSVGFVMNVSSVSVIYFGGYRIDSGDLMVGQMMAFLSYLMQILIAVMIASMMIVMAPRAVVSGRRIREVLDTVPKIHSPKNPATGPHTGIVEFKNVNFSYPDAEAAILKNINFVAKPGTTTAIIGSTGSGKTTIASLIPRLYDISGGELLVDGISVSDYELEDLWSRIGLVPQSPYLFSGTIRSNLCFGKEDATDEELWHALDTAEARDFVEKLPDGLDAEVAQGGTNFSGGQRQRLSIARALTKPCHTFIFDDSFSALDVATDARLRGKLNERMSDAALIIVAQRVSTIQNADQIIVLDHGEIVGVGKHDELVANCPTYQEIVESQFQEVEA